MIGASFSISILISWVRFSALRDCSKVYSILDIINYKYIYFKLINVII